MLVRFLLAYGVVAPLADNPSDRWYSLVRTKYNEFARKLERGDPSFLKFLDPSFVYIDPDGRRMSAKEWSDGMRAACRRNKEARVHFRITEIRKRQDRVLVSYVWSYRYKSSGGRNPLPRLTESISTDTWKIAGNDIRLAISKDFRIWHRADSGDSYSR